LLSKPGGRGGQIVHYVADVMELAGHRENCRRK
jgi:hypothetical protein